MTRIEVDDSAKWAALAFVKDGVHDRIAQYGTGAFVNNHEAFGVIAEEYDELLDALRTNEDEFEEELIDLAVACLFALASIDARQRAGR